MIVAVVLAAGASTRMGSSKQLLQTAGRPMLEQVLMTLRRTKVDRVIVVLGADEAKIRSAVSFQDEEVVSNPGHSEGMSGSLRVGVEAAKRAGASALMVVLADQPFVSPSTVDRIIEGYLESKAPVAAPYYGGRRGNPVLFDREVFPELLKVGGDNGARRVVESYRSSMLKVSVSDEGVLVDIDTPEDYERLGKKVGTTGREQSHSNPGA